MELKKRKLILDVDTGSDDALAIMSAVLSPEFDIVGICTVNGNRPVEYTTENTLRVLDLLKADVPVIRGCGTPITATLDPLRKMRQRSNDGVDENGEEVTYHTEYLPLPPATKKAVEEPMQYAGILTL
jgi:inosine-uridine nucleoside N-ribohydrolase